jgi:ribosomal protein S18 acetylase RimI-like enzyme
MAIVITHDRYEIDDNPARIDLAAVWQFLSGEAYWATWRTKADVRAQVEGAWRVVGCYDHHRMVGFARALSDGVALAYLADVYVLAEHRGRGIGEALVREMIENAAGVRVPLDAAHRRRARTLPQVRLHHAGSHLHGTGGRGLTSSSV